MRQQCFQRAPALRACARQTPTCTCYIIWNSRQSQGALPNLGRLPEVSGGPAASHGLGGGRPAVASGDRLDGAAGRETDDRSGVLGCRDERVSKRGARPSCFAMSGSSRSKHGCMRSHMRSSPCGACARPPSQRSTSGFFGNCDNDVGFALVFVMYASDRPAGTLRGALMPDRSVALRLDSWA